MYIVAIQAAAFAFDENASLDDNLFAFGNYIDQIDAPLGADMRKQFSALLEGTYKADDVWDRLFEICAAPPTEDKDTSEVEVAIAPTNAATAPPLAAPLPTVTGWLLEGISIEAFRGVNNEGRPLELKLQPAKVSSISAVNGVGKTSVYDAVRYAITGKLPWLDELPAAERDKDYYQN